MDFPIGTQFIKNLSENLSLTDTPTVHRFYSTTLTETSTFTDSFLTSSLNQQILSKRIKFQQIIRTHGYLGTLTRNSETIDNMGGLTNAVGTNWNVYFMIQDITLNDRNIIEMGLAVPGNVKAFFYNEYTSTMTGTTAVTPQVGDIVTDRYVNSWRIEQILGAREMNNNVLFISAILKKINLT